MHGALRRGAVAELHAVVAADHGTVLRHLVGDPHPIAFIRVLLNVEICRRMFGAGPWDGLATAWRQAHPPAPRAFPEHSLKLLPGLAELSLLRRMRAFGGRAIGDLVDPARVRPDALEQWSRQFGSALATTPHWATAEPVRLLALSSYQMAIAPERAAEITQQYDSWTQRLGSLVQAA